MRLNRWIATAAVSAIAVTGLAACGGSSDDGTSQNSTELSKSYDINEQPRSALAQGGTLTTSVPEITPQFNTFQADSTLYSLNFWRWYNPTLILFKPDGTAYANPDYLTDYKVDTVDGKTVATYTINPKAVYNDGTPIDWKSFQATWEANNGTNKAYLPSSTDGYSQIESVKEGTDSRQAVVTFKGIYAWTDGLFNVLLNPEALDPDVYNKGYVDNPHPEWGAGPYTLDKIGRAHV